MRRGRVFKRCSKCGARVAEKRCGCGSELFSWSFVVDVARRGERRQQRTKAGFATKTAAVDAMSRLQVAKADGNYIESSRVKLGTYLETWLEGADLRGLAGNTVRDYGISIRRHIVPKLGDVTLQALTTTQIEALYAQLLKTGKASRRRGDETRGPLSRKMVHNIHICLRAALQDALEADPPLIRRNPASKAFAYSPTKDRREMATWSTEEIQAFLDFTARDREAPLYRTAVMTGLRRGELLGVRGSDLHLMFKRLQVRQQWARDGARGLRIKGLKTGTKAWRTIDLDDVTVDALRKRLEQRELERGQWGTERADMDLVFCNVDGSPLDVDVVTRRFQRRAKDAGARPIRFHDLRHTHATLLLENGEGLKYVAERLGDRDDTVLLTYSHVTPKARAAAVGRLAALIDGTKFPAESAEATR